jgi:hypothetical protein
MRFHFPEGRSGWLAARFMSTPASMKPSVRAMDVERRLLHALVEALPSVLPEVTGHVMEKARADHDGLEHGHTRVRLDGGRKWRPAASPPPSSLPEPALPRPELPMELTVVVTATRQLAGQMATEEVRMERAVDMVVDDGGVLFGGELYVQAINLDADAVEETLLRAFGFFHMSDEDEYGSEGETGSEGGSD